MSDEDKKEEAIYIGAALARRWTGVAMSFKELAARMKLSAEHCRHVISGKKPLTKTFRGRLESILTQAEAGTLAEVKIKTRKEDVSYGYVGSAAFLPDDWEAPQGQEATDQPAGSWAKVEIMRERAERGEAIWHPMDRKMLKRHEER